MSEKRFYKGILIDDQRDELLSDMGKETLADRYSVKKENGELETFQETFARPAVHFSDNLEHAQRLYDYFSKHWAMPSTPVLSNGGTTRGFSVSCFLNEVDDDLGGIWDNYRENMRLASMGGGIGTYYGGLRAVGEKAGSGETSGVIPFLHILDSQVLAVSQGGIRRGSAAVYIHIEHPEVEEFLGMRKASGGDTNRKSLNLNHGLVISDAFMLAVTEDATWYYKSPKTGLTVLKQNGEPRCIRARELWARIIDVRMETGEPYLLFIDTVNEDIQDYHKRAELFVKTSNLCVEILRPTNNERTGICVLSSVNAEMYHEWKGNRLFIEDMHRFLDNVLEDFLAKASIRNDDGSLKYPEMQKAVFSGRQERAIGLGLMGSHAFFQSIGVPFESQEARVWNKKIHRFIRDVTDEVSVRLAHEKGPCPDAARYGVMERNTNKIAIAPTASISIFCDNTSPGIDPFTANAYTHKTKNGSFLIKNRNFEKLLEAKGQNTHEVWADIIAHSGSCQHLEFLTDHEKSIYRTAYEIDQNWVITHAADRAPFIDQSASTNLFFPAIADKAYIHQCHWRAWAEGVKSLYYCRTTALKSVTGISGQIKRERLEESFVPEDLSEKTFVERGGVSFMPPSPIGEERASSFEEEQAKFAVCEACQ